MNKKDNSWNPAFVIALLYAKTTQLMTLGVKFFSVAAKIHFQADSDAIISKGIVAILLSVLNNRSPHEILSADLSFIDEIGLKEHLSPNRANGLSSMLKQIKFYALAYSKLNQK